MVTLNANPENWSFDCRDCVVQMIQIDFRLTLIIADGCDSVRTTIESIGKLHLDGKEYLFDPEQTASLAPILPLFNAAVSGITLTSNGKLQVCFVSGSTIEVNASDQCEAWDVGCLINGVGHLFVCAPGGEVAFFQGQVGSSSRS